MLLTLLLLLVVVDAWERVEVVAVSAAAVDEGDAESVLCAPAGADGDNAASAALIASTTIPTNNLSSNSLPSFSALLATSSNCFVSVERLTELGET